MSAVIPGVTHCYQSAVIWAISCKFTLLIAPRQLHAVRGYLGGRSEVNFRHSVYDAVYADYV